MASKKTPPKVSKSPVVVEGAKLPVQPVFLQSGSTAINVEQKKEKTLPADYEYVDHPSHYNGHPSGVEAIDLCEVLSFNVGSAFKYVYRRDDKVNPVQDLQKARWYIVREIAFLTSSWRRYLPSWLHSMFVSNPLMSDYHYEFADAVLRTEKNTHAKLFYNAVLHSTEVHNYATQDLRAALNALDKLIKSYEVTEVTEAPQEQELKPVTKQPKAKVARTKKTTA